MYNEVEEVLRAIAEFNKAMDGDSGDAELDAAISMRDRAMELCVACSACDVDIAELIDRLGPFL